MSSSTVLSLCESNQHDRKIQVQPNHFYGVIEKGRSWATFGIKYPLNLFLTGKGPERPRNCITQWW
jgi:hypothetical protein